MTEDITTTLEETERPRLTATLQDVGGTVRRDLRNAHAGYDYASADAIYSHVRPAVLRAGLLPYQQELEVEMFERPSKSGPKTWARVVYGLGLVDGTGPVPADALEHVTVLVQITGSQSMGAARTYALKYWLRGKFLLATGDESEDLDSTPRPEEPPTPPIGRRRPFKRYVQDQRSKMATAVEDQTEPIPTMAEDVIAVPREPLTEAEMDVLQADLMAHGKGRGMEPNAVRAALNERYGSPSVYEWTDDQRRDAMRRLAGAVIARGKRDG